MLCSRPIAFYWNALPFPDAQQFYAFVDTLGATADAQHNVRTSAVKHSDPRRRWEKQKKKNKAKKPKKNNNNNNCPSAMELIMSECMSFTHGFCINNSGL